ncbi:MAG TPA: 50S ribosomal protein L20 [Candidatus Nanoarchaeia archaeon]|nr:50S ribosomal protein L20 [Candidatus Nanoarchaeia archaeon]
MPRVKRGTIHVKKRRKLFRKTKGYKWNRKNTIRTGATAVVKAGVHAFTDRRKKKRTARYLWQIKIGIAAKELGISYSRLMGALHANKIDLDRKVLADLAENNKEIFAKIVASVKK